MAVFDGHNGAEASEMASKLLLEYFVLHTYFLLDSTFLFISKKSLGMLPDNEEHHLTFQELNWDNVGDWHASDNERCFSFPTTLFYVWAHFVCTAW